MPSIRNLYDGNKRKTFNPFVRVGDDPKGKQKDALLPKRSNKFPENSCLIEVFDKT